MDTKHVFVFWHLHERGIGQAFPSTYWPSDCPSGSVGNLGDGGLGWLPCGHLFKFRHRIRSHLSLQAIPVWSLFHRGSYWIPNWDCIWWNLYRQDRRFFHTPKRWYQRARDETPSYHPKHDTRASITCLVRYWYREKIALDGPNLGTCIMSVSSIGPELLC